MSTKNLTSQINAWWRFLVYSELQTFCWFCGQESIISSKDKDKWICQYCEQQNGFNEDGDYVHPIQAQFAVKEDAPTQSTAVKHVGVLCQICSHHQTIKLRQLAAYSPIDENNYDEEIAEYKNYLETVYRLCQSCDQKVFELLKNQDETLLEKMDTEHLEKIGSCRGQNLVFQTMKNITQTPLLKRKYLPSLILLLCFLFATALIILNARLTATSPKMFSNSLLQNCIDFLVQNIAYRTALDFSELLEYSGTILCFTALYTAGMVCWYPEDAAHLNLWMLTVIISNKEVTALVPALAVSRGLHVFLSACTAVAAAACTLRPRVPRHIESVSLERRPIKSAMSISRSEIPLPHQSIQKNNILEIESLQEKPRNSSNIDSFVKDLNSFSLGSRNSLQSPSQFWSVSGTPESSDSSNSSVLSTASSSSLHARPVISPSKLSYLDFQGARRDRISPLHKRSPPLINELNRSRVPSAELQTKTSRVSPSQYSVRATSPIMTTSSHVNTRLEQIPHKNQHPFENKKVNDTRHFRTLKEQEKKVKKEGPGIFNKTNLKEEIRRSSRIATKSRPWPLRKALSCTNTYDNDISNLLEEMSKKKDDDLMEESSSNISCNISNVQKTSDLSKSANANETLPQISSQASSSSINQMPDSSTT